MSDSFENRGTEGITEGCFCIHRCIADNGRCESDIGNNYVLDFKITELSYERAVCGHEWRRVR